MNTVFSGNDHLAIGKVAAITAQLNKGEKIVFTCKVRKQNRFRMWQNRDFLLTTQRVCNLNGTDLKRGIEIAQVKAVTRNI